MVQSGTRFGFEWRFIVRAWSSRLALLVVTKRSVVIERLVVVRVRFDVAAVVIVLARLVDVDVVAGQARTHSGR